MSVSGSPSTATRSASRPGTMAPIVFCRFIDSAPREVRSINASIGFRCAHAEWSLSRSGHALLHWRLCHHHLESGRPQRHCEHGSAEGMRLFHRRKTFFGVISETQKARLVLEIVWEVESDVGIEPNSVLSEHSEGFLGRQHAMLDSRATCTRCADHRFGALRMDHCAEALRASFAADGIELCLRKRRCTALPNAGRCEDLDEIGPLRFLLSNVFAKLLRR